MSSQIIRINRGKKERKKEKNVPLDQLFLLGGMPQLVLLQRLRVLPLRVQIIDGRRAVRVSFFFIVSSRRIVSQSDELVLEALDVGIVEIVVERVVDRVIAARDPRAMFEIFVLNAG